MDLKKSTKVNSFSTLFSTYKFEGLLTILAFVLVGYSTQKHIGDFGNHYYGSLFFLDGTWGPWVFDPASFNLRIYELGQRNFFLDYTAPPLSAIIYLPFALLSITKAKIVWNCISAILLVITFIRINRYFTIPKQLLFLCFVALVIPIRNNFYDGQSYILLCYLLVEGLIQYLKGNTWLMAIAWAICIHLKITPLIVVFFLLLNQSYKATLQLAIVSVGLVLVSIPFVGAPIWKLFLIELMPRLAEGEINNPYALNYQSMQVLLRSIFVYDELFNPNSPYHLPSLYYKLLLLFKAILMVIGISFSLGNNTRQEKFAIWMLIMLLISGYGNSFSLIFLLFPMAFFYDKLVNLSFGHKAIVIMLFLVAVIPFYWFQSMLLPFRFPRLYSLLAVLLILYYISEFKFYKPLLLLSLLTLVLPPKKLNTPQTYLLKGDSPLLIYDFTVEGQQLKLNVFDFNGPKIEYYKLPEAVRKVEIVADKKESWRRVKRICVNDADEYFLSDVSRGAGFYTIHKQNKQAYKN